MPQLLSGHNEASILLQYPRGYRNTQPVITLYVERKSFNTQATQNDSLLYLYQIQDNITIISLCMNNNPNLFSTIHFIISLLTLTINFIQLIEQSKLNYICI